MDIRHNGKPMLAALALGISFFCGACQVGNKAELPPPPASTVRNIEVQAGQVNILSAGPLRPGAFIMGNPPRLIIEIKNAELSSQAPASGPGVGDFVKEWSAEQKTVMRQMPEGEAKEVPVVSVTLVLNKNITYKLTSESSGCSVALEEVKKAEDESGKSGNIEIPKELYAQVQKIGVTKSGQPTGTVVVPISPGDEKAAREMLNQIVPERAPVVKLPAATALQNITYKATPDGIEITITGDGEFRNYEPVSLDLPLRVAIDFFGVKSPMKKKTLLVNNGRTRQIRVGSYPDKTRVVVELSGNKIKDSRIVSVQNKLLVKIVY